MRANVPFKRTVYLINGNALGCYYWTFELVGRLWSVHVQKDIDIIPKHTELLAIGCQ